MKYQISFFNPFVSLGLLLPCRQLSFGIIRQPSLAPNAVKSLLDQVSTPK